MKKRYFLTLLCLCMAILLCIPASAVTDCYRWYCVRQKDHRQPTADANMQWIRDFGGCYVDPVHGDENEDKVLYLTFDAGYENGNVQKVLDALQEEQVPGAFFILDQLLLKNADLVRRMVNEGHMVLNHTAKHKNITTCQSKEELARELSALETLYSQTVGGEMAKIFRPPEGSFSKQSMQWLHELGYRTVFWSFAYADWDNGRQPNPEAAKKKILDNLHNGAVILLHPTSQTNALILRDVIRECKAQGYRFGTLDELIANQG